MMITSELKDGIVWVIVEGKLDIEEAMKEISQWLSQKDTFNGFVTDVRKLSPIPGLGEQKRLEDWRKSNNSGKPHAILGRDTAWGAVIKMYVRLTKAETTRYFTNVYAATAWIKSFEKK